MNILHGLKGFDDLIVLRMDSPCYSGQKGIGTMPDARMRKWASSRPWVATLIVPHINFTLHEPAVILEKAWNETWAGNPQ